MLFLLNKPERFTCTVQQSKAKANKRDINPSYCVNLNFSPRNATVDSDVSRNSISQSQLIFTMYNVLQFLPVKINY